MVLLSDLEYPRQEMRTTMKSHGNGIEKNAYTQNQKEEVVFSHEKGGLKEFNIQNILKAK